MKGVEFMAIAAYPQSMLELVGVEACVDIASQELLYKHESSMNERMASAPNRPAGGRMGLHLPN